MLAERGFYKNKEDPAMFKATARAFVCFIFDFKSGISGMV